MPKYVFNKVNFIEITLRHKCSHVNLLHIFRTSFKDSCERQPLENLETSSFFYRKFNEFNFYYK